MTPLVPTILERRVLPKVWGGRVLETVPGLELGGAGAIGETWEVYDRPDGASAFRGRSDTLRDWMEQAPRELLGAGVEPTPDGYFPLLIKYIDARKALSVQVHPDDDAARAEKDWGKTEAWIVLDVDDDGRIIRGFKPGATAQRFREVAHTSEVEGLLHAFRPEVGDVVFVPPGTVHAIGPGVVVYEVQQNSDVTYRLYDWGRPREVHVDKALAVTVVEPYEGEGRPVIPAEPIDERSRWLIRTDRFRVREFGSADAMTLPVEGSVKVLSLIEGRCTLGWMSGGEDPPLLLQPGDSVLVPACCGDVFVSPVGKVRLYWADSGGVG